jgi:hypothetical protein
VLLLLVEDGMVVVVSLWMCKLARVNDAQSAFRRGRV